MRYLSGLMLSLAAAMLAAPALAQQDPEPTSTDAPRAEVLVLGTYHMSNPGRDLFNMQADDVLSAQRQAEIESLMQVLEKFKPTRIAVEADPNSKRIPERYAEYLAGNHELSRNETEQIGFRLARRMGHPTVFPVDADGEFPYARVVKFAKATGRMAEIEALQKETGEQVQAMDQFLSTHTILETLLFMNADEHVGSSMDFYFRVAQLSENWDWAGPDLVADWFRRNMRIYGNITELIESPAERVLVVYGAGHQGWLQFAFGNNRNYRLRKLADFAD